MVDCIKFNPDIRYTQKELEETLPAVSDDSAGKAPTPKGTQRGLPLVNKRCLFVQHCKENAASLPESLWYAMISNLAVFDGGDRAIHDFSVGYPKYQSEETQEKIMHFVKSKTKPITCATIAERGFTCPKARDGSCVCKAPALSFKPMEVDDLRDALAECSKAEAATDNMNTAKEFVTQYLYNAKAVMGDALSAMRFAATSISAPPTLGAFYPCKKASIKNTKKIGKRGV